MFQFFNNLATEINVAISEKCDVSTLESMALLNKKGHEIYTNLLWKERLRQNFPERFEVIQNKKVDFKNEYIEYRNIFNKMSIANCYLIPWPNNPQLVLHLLKKGDTFEQLEKRLGDIGTEKMGTHSMFSYKFYTLDVMGIKELTDNLSEKLPQAVIHPNAFLATIKTPFQSILIYPQSNSSEGERFQKAMKFFRSILTNFLKTGGISEEDIKKNDDIVKHIFPELRECNNNNNSNDTSNSHLIQRF